MTTTDTTREKPKWIPKFLDGFAEQKTVSAASKLAGINRSTVYERRKTDPEFEEQFLDVEEEITQALEREAMRRAAEGVTRPIFHLGKEIGVERKFSDTLLIFLLKARRPDVYRERIDIQDERERSERAEIARASDAELDARLVGFDNVTSISKNGKRRKA